jgi:hypothetical protein
MRSETESFDIGFKLDLDLPDQFNEYTQGLVKQNLEAFFYNMIADIVEEGVIEEVEPSDNYRKVFGNE